MKLFLAPMDGVVDWVMRDLLTRIGGVDRCITEFVRIKDVVFPDYIFYKRCPELLTGGTTASGVPVYVQILGGQVEPMAANALKAVELGAPGIDINFGCPARTVNNSDGGATLLKSCDRIYDIVKAVRLTVPRHIPVTVKIRLGYEEPTRCVEIASAIEDAGADLLTVHCRTKQDGYKPPAYWEWIPRIREKIKLEMVVNGEIWNLEDFKRCQEVTGESNFMIGRGALADPFLFQRIRGAYIDANWNEAKKLLPIFYASNLTYKDENYAITRTKQWLKSLSLKHPEAGTVFQQTRQLVQAPDFKSAIDLFVNSESDTKD